MGDSSNVTRRGGCDGEDDALDWLRLHWRWIAFRLFRRGSCITNIHTYPVYANPLRKIMFFVGLVQLTKQNQLFNFWLETLVVTKPVPNSGTFSFNKRWKMRCRLSPPVNLFEIWKYCHKGIEIPAMPDTKLSSFRCIQLNKTRWDQNIALKQCLVRPIQMMIICQKKYWTKPSNHQTKASTTCKP